MLISEPIQLTALSTGRLVDMTDGGTAEVVGGTVEVVGGTVEVVGDTVEVVGDTVEVVGDTVEVVGEVDGVIREVIVSDEGVVEVVRDVGETLD
jgi:hypothetical protein